MLQNRLLCPEITANPIFLKLSPEVKLAYFYLLQAADNCGCSKIAEAGTYCESITEETVDILINIGILDYVPIPNENKGIVYHIGFSESNKKLKGGFSPYRVYLRELQTRTLLIVPPQDHYGRKTIEGKEGRKQEPKTVGGEPIENIPF